MYIQEIPSGSRTITGVATAVAAFVGRAAARARRRARGDHLVAEFERTFGGADAGRGIGYAVRDYYLNGGHQAVIVRLAAATPPRDGRSDGALTSWRFGPGALGQRVDVEVTHATDPEASHVAAQQGVDADSCST